MILLWKMERYEVSFTIKKKIAHQEMHLTVYYERMDLGAYYNCHYYLIRPSEDSPLYVFKKNQLALSHHIPQARD